MIRKNNSMNRVQVVGNSPINIINNAVMNGVSICNINKLDSKNIEFDIKDRDLSKLKGLDTRGCSIKIIKYGGKKQLLEILLSRIGLVIGLIISFVGVLILQNRLLQIHILGLSDTNRDAVVEMLNSKGISLFSNPTY